MTLEAMARLTNTARISLKPRTGKFVTFVTIIHHFGQTNQLVRSILWNDADMQLLADTGARMPTWWKPLCVDCGDDVGMFQYDYGKICGGCLALHLHGIECFVPSCNRYTVDWYDDLPMCPHCMAGYIEGLGM